MIISKTPFRISYLGGGTDFPEWYLKNTGKVLSTTIDKYNYVVLNRLPDIFKYNYRVRYYYSERCKNINEIKHPSIRNLAKLYNIKNLDLLHFSDLVGMSGIGSSSAFTVGTIKALTELMNIRLSKDQHATQAINIERNLNNEHIGCQDQYACAFGGFNSISFNKNKIKVLRLNDCIKNKKLINQSTMLLYTGAHRNSQIQSRELVSQIKKGNNFVYLEKIRKFSEIGEKMIKSKSFSNKIFGELLNESWQYKKSCSKKISNKTIELIEADAKKFGAYASKVIGAGGGGFMIIYAEKKFQNVIKKKLNKFKFVNFKFSNEGSKIIIKS